MKAAHLPTLVEILGSIHGYLLYNDLRGLLERGNYLLRLLGTRETCLSKTLRGLGRFPSAYQEFRNKLPGTSIQDRII